MKARPLRRHDPAGPPDRPGGQPAGQPAGPPAETSGAAQRPAADSSPTARWIPPPPSRWTFRPAPATAPCRRRTPPPPPAALLRPDAPAGRGSQPLNFFDWIRSQGIHRGRERWVGGVASGIAQRFGVDPLIVRGILIVLTVFAGVGVLLYGIAWALLPEPDGRIHVQEAAAGRWSSGMTGALITTVIGFPSLGAGVWGWDRYGFGALHLDGLLGGGRHLPHLLPDPAQQVPERSHSHVLESPARRPGWPRLSATEPGNAVQHRRLRSPPPATARSDALPRYGESTVPGPAWGTPPPSGPVPPPGGGYRPVPGGGPVPPAKPRNFGPGAPAVAVTAGLALLVGGGIKALDVANVIDLGTSSNAVVWASAAVVLGLGILIAGLRGRTSGILGFFAAVALIVGGIFNVLPNGDRFRPQNADWSPVSIEQARDGFDITAGTGTVDLTRLALNPPLRTDVVVPIDATASNLTVIIPDTVPVEVRADMTMGNLNEGSQNHGGMTTQQSNYNTGKPGATLIVKIDGTFSNVTIKEGN